eukprot:10758758-Karenia_brevis.AAC.1
MITLGLPGHVVGAVLDSILTTFLACAQECGIPSSASMPAPAPGDWSKAVGPLDAPSDGSGNRSGASQPLHPPGVWCSRAHDDDQVGRHTCGQDATSARVARPKERKPSAVVCRHGANCKFHTLGQCWFKHEPVASSALATSAQPFE